MIAQLWAWMTHRDRKVRTEHTLHQLRTRSQVAEAERHLIRQVREADGDMTWLEDALTRRAARRESEGTPP